VIDLLSAADRAVLLFINATLANPVGDILWPRITDYDKFWPVRIVLLGAWLWLMIRGGSRGRTAALMLIPVIFCADKCNSAFIKDLVGRLRPCHQIDGITIVQGLHMLVDCGPGKSFASSHAVNNFAVATVFSFYYRRWTWAFLAWASLIAVSRVAVGVHYPSDVIGGACIGAAIALFLITVWTQVQERWFPHLSLQKMNRAKEEIPTEPSGGG
jgi:undecaprenyl-diphosphatase